MADGYYNRFDSAKEFDAHLFRADRVLQSAELNEIQSNAIQRVRGIGDALFKDGNVIRDARIIVNPITGVVTCESGAIYLQGAVRGVPAASITVSVAGIVDVGIYLQSSLVTEIEDPSLRDPASLTQNYMEAGAARQKVHAAWGASGDGQTGDFFPIYVVDNGVLRAKEPPPNIDAVTQAVASYDRDSSGGTYVVSGLDVKVLDDLVSGDQVYSVAHGRARVNGFAVSLGASKRLILAATPDYRQITNEPHNSTTVGSQRVDFALTPGANITEVNIRSEKTVSVVHGGYTGVSDPLPDTSIAQLVSVVQGGTTYVQGTDYTLTGNSVNWSPTGSEMATGSTYTVVYQYYTNVTPTAVDSTGFTVTGAVVGTNIQVTYSQKIPRYDRLTMDVDGNFTWIKGVASAWNAQPLPAPTGSLSLALVYQDWVSNPRTVVNDSVRVVPMDELSSINARMDYMLGLISQQQLISDINLREGGQKKGLFVDPFLDDSLRDAGTAQTAAVFDGQLTLPSTVDAVAAMPSDVSSPVTLAFSLITALNQSAITSSMNVNPYMAFAPIPANVALTPSIDQWTVSNSTFVSDVTRSITTGGDSVSRLVRTTSIETLSAVVGVAKFLRPIEVRFSVSGFGSLEVLSSVTFDGVSVTPVAI